MVAEVVMLSYATQCLQIAYSSALEVASCVPDEAQFVQEVLGWIQVHVLEVHRRL